MKQRTSWVKEGRVESALLQKSQHDAIWDESEARVTLLLVSSILDLHLSFLEMEAHSAVQ